MRRLIKVSGGKLKDIYKRKYDLFITFVDKVDEDVIPDGEYYTHEEFAGYIREARPYGVICSVDTQDELDFLINLIYDFVGSIYLFIKHNRVFDLTLMEKCAELDAVQLYHNTKQAVLWDVKKNTKLRGFEIMDYYHISDLSMFAGSSVEMLRFYGCNGCSSFVSKMHVDDFSFVMDMPRLTELGFDIIKDEASEYYLRILSRLQGLKVLYTPHGFFTFQQFAWLRAKLPNVEKGLDCITSFDDSCSIIGRKTPKMLDDPKKAEQYQKRYDALVEKYKNRENPPLDSEKD